MTTLQTAINDLIYSATPKQTIRIDAFGNAFTFEIPITENTYQPLLDSDTKTCVLVLPNGDVVQPQAQSIFSRVVFGGDTGQVILVGANKSAAAIVNIGGENE